MSNFDIVNSAFGNDAMDNSTLMPIRLYTALSIHRPMLVNNNTQLGQEVSNYGLGFVIEDYTNLADNLFNYFSNLNYAEFIKRCDNYIKMARTENDIFYSELRKLL